MSDNCQIEETRTYRIRVWRLGRAIRKENTSVTTPVTTPVSTLDKTSDRTQIMHAVIFLRQCIAKRERIGYTIA